MNIIILSAILLMPFTGMQNTPSEKFQKSVLYFEKDYGILKSKPGSDIEYRNFHCLSNNGLWTHGTTELKAEVWSITLKAKKQIEKNHYARVMITEFQFSSLSETNKAKEILKAYSDELWRMKLMNNYFFKGNCAYIIQTDAVMFEKDYNSVTSRFKKYMEL